MTNPQIDILPNSLEHLVHELFGRFNFELKSHESFTHVEVSVKSYDGRPVRLEIIEVKNGLLMQAGEVPIVGCGVDVDFILAQLNTFDSGFTK